MVYHSTAPQKNILSIEIQPYIYYQFGEIYKFRKCRDYKVLS